MTTSLFTHHHYGWRKHDLADATDQSILAALIETHGFLSEYAGEYVVKTERRDDRSYDGVTAVYWDGEKPKSFYGGHFIVKGDYWFKAFEFNVADAGACRYCGGAGRDHYLPFAHCWACDGTAVQVRTHTPRGFVHKPTPDCPPAMHEKYSEYLASLAVAA